MAAGAREEILEKIRSALRGDGAEASPEGVSGLREKRISVAPETAPERDGLIKQFERELGLLGARFHLASSRESACEYVERLAAERRADVAVGWNAPVVDELGLRERLESAGIRWIADDGTEPGDQFTASAINAGIGITGVDYALADTGTIVLLSGRGRARSASLIAPIHVAILKPEQIIPGLNELMPLLDEKGSQGERELPSAVAFITGPSRTADIELMLVVGVHGPQQLHVILLA